MPCNTCTDEARCDRAGLCQDFARQQLQQHHEAAARDCIAPTGCWWPKCGCAPTAQACGSQAECDRGAQCRSENHCRRGVDAAHDVMGKENDRG